MVPIAVRTCVKQRRMSYSLSSVLLFSNRIRMQSSVAMLKSKDFSEKVRNESTSTNSKQGSLPLA